MVFIGEECELLMIWPAKYCFCFLQSRNRINKTRIDAMVICEGSESGSLDELFNKV